MDIFKAINIIEKQKIFLGKRAGRELWSREIPEIQDNDIKQFNKDMDYLMKILKEMQKYKDLKIQGLILEIPCKLGDTVYVKTLDGELVEAEVKDFSYFNTCGFCVVVTSDKFDKFDKCSIPFSEFNKTVFLPQQVIKQM